MHCLVGECVVTVRKTIWGHTVSIVSRACTLACNICIKNEAILDTINCLLESRKFQYQRCSILHKIVSVGNSCTTSTFQQGFIMLSSLPRSCRSIYVKLMTKIVIIGPTAKWYSHYISLTFCTISTVHEGSYIQ